MHVKLFPIVSLECVVRRNVYEKNLKLNKLIVNSNVNCILKESFEYFWNLNYLVTSGAEQTVNYFLLKICLNKEFYNSVLQQKLTCYVE